MTLSIYKYPIVDGQSVFLPVNAQILHVGLDLQDVLNLWALVDPAEKIEARKFFIYDTGQFITGLPGTQIHLATVRSGKYMDHVFMEYTAPTKMLL